MQKYLHFFSLSAIFFTATKILEDKIMKKFLAILMALTLIVMGFAACGNKPVVDEGGETEPLSSAKPVLTMGTNATFPPYEFYEGDKIVGIDAEIAQLIADKLDMQLVIKDMDFNGILAAVSGGTIDIGMAGMTVNEERLLEVNFSTSYAKGVQVVIVKEDSDIASIDDLAGKKIGVQESTTGDIYASDDFGEESMLRYNKGTDAVAALVNGTVDAVIIDNEPAKAFVKETAGLKILDTSYADEDYAIAVAKTNTELLSKIDAALNELIADGSVQSIIDKYISAE